MEIPVRNMQGEVVGQLELDERVFGIEPNRAVLHQAVVAQRANGRRGTADTKTRAEVAGGGRKPYRQKGTGYARQGSIRAPHYRHGGIVFGPHPRSYEQRLPRKMRRLAMRSALSDKVARDQFVVVDQLELEAPKAKAVLQVLSALGASDGALIVVPERDEALARASGNLPRVRAVTPGGLNLLDVLNARSVLMTREAVGVVSEQLTREVRRGAAPAGTAAETT